MILGFYNLEVTSESRSLIIAQFESHFSYKKELWNCVI